MAPSLQVTHIGTATAILDINGVNFLTDPFFSRRAPRGPMALLLSQYPMILL